MLHWLQREQYRWTISQASCHATDTRTALKLRSDPSGQHLFGIWDLKNKYVLPSLSNAR
jgi:hypothetical protein